MRRAVVYLVLAFLAGLVGVVSLSGELNGDSYSVDALITGTHTERSGGPNGARSTVYYVDVERLDTMEQDTVRNARFYDAYQASGETDVTLDVLATGEGVERITGVHYLGRTYDATTKAEGIGVSIAFLVVALVFLVLGIRRLVVVRRKRAEAPIPPPPSPAPGIP